MTRPVKVLTSAQMNEIDRRTIESGIPGMILMENAAQRVVELLEEKFSPLSDRRIVVFCGRGNNGGDGLAIARQLWTRFRPNALRVVMTSPVGDLNRDASANFQMLKAAGFSGIYTGALDHIPADMQMAEVLVDAVLGTGVNGAARGGPLDAIRIINTQFPLAKVVAVDIPSGLSSDTGAVIGEYVRADYTVTFTAFKVGQVVSPACDLMGELRLGAIGTPPEMIEGESSIQLGLITPEFIAPLFAPRGKDSNKGNYGHVLVIAGSRGKAGAAAMTGLAALRAGAGLVTVASAESAIATISSHAPELMTAPLPETAEGTLAEHAFEVVRRLFERKNVIAVGPGLSTHPETVKVVRRLFREVETTMIVDADGLNALADSDWTGSGHARILTPHPGEMSRLSGKEIDEIQADRVGTAREFASAMDVHLVLKGHCTLIASKGADVLVNPVDSPALATAGTGDVLTGLVAGLVAQSDLSAEGIRQAVAGAVYLHGLSGQMGARVVGEQAFIATDLLRFLPEAQSSIRNR